MSPRRELALFSVGSFALGVAVATAFASGRADATPARDDPYTMMGQLGRVVALIENAYVDPVDRARLLEGATKGMVAELDPHSGYMPPVDFVDFQNDTEGKFAGVGIEVDTREGALVVVAPIEGSPAEAAGLKSGDRIVAVDGEAVLDPSLEKMVKRMRGEAGTKLRLTIKRPGVKDLLTYDLTRAIVRVSSVVSKALDDGLAYIRVKQFQENTHVELLREVAKLRTTLGREPLGVIVDMRLNPGGLVDEAAEVADEFLDEGTIYTTRHRGKITDEVKARRGGALVSMPVVVLINEYSASAAELVTGALQDHKRAIVVGDDSFGKGSVQSILELPLGAGIRLTTARYYTPSGRAIQAEGVHPDVLVLAPRLMGAPVVRERDLEGHLPSEARAPQKKPPRPAPASPTPRDSTNDGGLDAGSTERGKRDDPAPEEPIDLRKMPSNLTNVGDVVLRRGFEVLRDAIAHRTPAAK